MPDKVVAEGVSKSFGDFPSVTVILVNCCVELLLRRAARSNTEASYLVLAMSVSLEDVGLHCSAHLTSVVSAVIDTKEYACRVSRFSSSVLLAPSSTSASGVAATSRSLLDLRNVDLGNIMPSGFLDDASVRGRRPARRQSYHRTSSTARSSRFVASR